MAGGTGMTRTAESRREQRREYYLRNREEILAKNAAWRSEHKDRVRQQQFEYQVKNKEELAVKARLYPSRQPGLRSDYSRAYRQDNKDLIRETQRAKRASHPEKYAAHKAVQNAIRRGEMSRLACEVCGSEKSHGHHEDYTKPLDVIWLCRTHHMERHRKHIT